MTDATCWICQSPHHQLWKPRSIDGPLKAEHLQITDSHYGATLKLYRCSECAFIFSDDAEVKELVGLYEQLQDPGYESTGDTRVLQMRWLLDHGSLTHPSARTLLDIGAASGLLVSEAARRGFDAVGVEPSRSLVEAARRLNGVELIQGTFPHPRLEGRRFDLIYLVDVIEHVSEPVALLEAAGRALAPGGALVVVTPDIASITSRMMGHRWWHLRLAHVGYFDPRTMRRAAARAGLEVIGEFRAKWFFPISYLAERLAVYLPIGAINRMARRVAPLRWLYEQTIPLDLRDSSVFLLKRTVAVPGRSLASTE